MATADLVAQLNFNESIANQLSSSYRQRALASLLQLPDVICDFKFEYLYMSSVSYTAYSTSVKTVSNLRHITAPLSALKIAISRQFISPNNPGSYDCGANFLGVLGEYENTQPIERGAALHCTWKGKVSDVLHWTTRPTNIPNVLYDFNGSCRMYQNNDPRFLLPYGSSGLILNAISIDNDEDLLRDWCYLRGGAYAWLYSRGWFRKRLLHAVKSEFAELNARCSSGEILISIHRGWPP